MRLNIYTSIVLVLVLATSACSNKQTEDTSGVVFTFDDHYVDSWWATRNLFDKYHIKATFFVTRPFLIDSVEKTMLYDLMRRGHEIGCHGMNHKVVTDYKGSDGIETYINKEIKPALHIFDSLNIPITSFAYPYGQHTELFDSALMRYFKVLRMATYHWETTPLDSAERMFTVQGKTRVVNAMMFDHASLSLDDVEKAIVRAKEKQEIVIFLAHHIDSCDALYVPSAYLEKVFKLCNKHGLKSMTMKEVY